MDQTDFRGLLQRAYETRRRTAMARAEAKVARSEARVNRGTVQMVRYVSVRLRQRSLGTATPTSV